MQKGRKTKQIRLLTVLLAVVMMFALSIQAYAATSKSVTQDGITNWDHITRDYTRYAEFDPDILISTIGANVKNGANEGDSGYENSYIFTKEKFKAILDYFNPGDDARVIVGGTPLMKNEIAYVIEEAAAAYGYDYVDMTDMTDDSYTAKAYESTLKTLFGVSAIDNGVLTHPGDIGMATIAERIWTKLSPMIPEGEEKPEDGGSDSEDQDVVFGYYFESSTEGFAPGGLTGMKQAEGALVLTAAADGRPRTWTTGNDANAKPLNTPAADVGYVKIMVQTEVTDQNFAIIAELIDASGVIKSVTYHVTPDWAETGYTEVLIDLKASGEWDDTLTLNRICVLPFGTVDNASLAGKVVYIDELEVLKAISVE